MSTSKTWPGGSTNVTPTTYSIPAAGEVNWANLSNFLNALGDGAQSTTFQKFAVRVATTTPVTFSTNDCIVATNLAIAGAVAVNLPAGSNKLVGFIVDRKGDAKTNNITITPNGAETINGSATLVLDGNNQGVMLAYNSTTSDWEIVLNSVSDGGSIGGFTASRAIVSDASGYLSSATTTADEIGYVNGVTSAIQTQINTKVTNPATTTGDTLYASTTATPATIARLGIGTANYVYVSTGTLPSWSLLANANVDAAAAIAYSKLNLSGSIVNADINAAAAIAYSKLEALTASRALVSDVSGFISAAATTSTQIGYLSGATGTTGTTTTNIVFSTSPALTTPSLGVATATSINKMAITAPASSSTLAVADGKTFTASNTLTMAGTDGQTFTFPNGSSTVMTLASVDTITGAKSFNDAKLILNGSTSGTSTVKAQAIAGTTTFTMPTTTGTLVGSGDTGTVTSTMILNGTIVNDDINASAAIDGSKLNVTVPTMSFCGVGQHTGGFSANGSGTYTTPAGVKWIFVRMVGGGGGGGGSTATNVSTAGTNGGNTTFGSSLLIANGGAPGNNAANSALPGSGGTSSVSSPAYGSAYTGNAGVFGAQPLAFCSGGYGGASIFGGVPGQGTNTAGGAAQGSSGSGGGGGGGGATPLYSGGGGGAGGWCTAIIPSPTTYAYVVGTAGGAGTGSGAGKTDGGAGGAGFIEVTEYYV
jgi:hypothetical protein